MAEIENLIEKIATGDKVAMGQLFASQYSIMKNYAGAILGSFGTESEDIANEAFISVWQKASNFKFNGSAQGWIRSIVRNRSYDFLRSQKSKNGKIFEAQNYILPPDNKDAEELFQTKQQSNQLQIGMSLLSNEHREVLWLCYFEEKSIKEIAVIIDCLEATVKTRLYYARQELKEIMIGIGNEN